MKETISAAIEWMRADHASGPEFLLAETAGGDPQPVTAHVAGAGQAPVVGDDLIVQFSTVAATADALTALGMAAPMIVDFPDLTADHAGGSAPLMVDYQVFVPGMGGSDQIG